MGGGGGSSDRAADEAARQQARIANQLFTQTDPLRRGLIDRSRDFLNRGVGDSAQFSAFKSAAEPQFAQARDSIIANTPTGGGLTDALADLEVGRARSLTEAQGAIEQDELARALTLGTGTVGTSVGGLGQAASIQAQRAQADAQREAGIYGAIGSGLGAFLGGK